MTITDERTKTLAAGAWSNGTLRAEDLAQTLLDMAESVGLASQHVDDLAHAFDAITDDDHECAGDSCAGEYVGECMQDVQDALQAFAPIYCYVGSAESEPDAIGVWAQHEMIQDAIRNGVPMGGDTSRVYNAEDNVIIVISDHGNVSVYTVETGAEILGLV